MKNLIKFVQYNECYKCKSKLTDKWTYCKTCEKRLEISKNKQYNSQKTQLTNAEIVAKAFQKVPVSKFRVIYYTNRQDISFWSQLQFEKFSSIEHLTSYVINSNRLPISQLVGEGSWDLGKLPQVRHFISKNQVLLTYTQSNTRGISQQSNFDCKIFRYIYSSDFWTKLIHLYINHFHRYVCLFDLKYFSINTTPQSLLTAIYCLGYRYFDEKSDKLTNYFDQLGSQNIQRIKFKPCLANVQALRIHQYIMSLEDRISEARACLLHITKMCQSLGLHINTKRFDSSATYNRNLVYTKILKLLLIMTKTYKVDLNFEFDIPNFNTVNYEPEWQLLSNTNAKLLNFTEEERQILSSVTAFENKYQDKLLLYLIFPNMKSYTNEQIEECCFDRYSKLTADYSKILRSYMLLMDKYPSSAEFIDFDKGTLDSSYLEICILIFEHGRFKSKGENPKLIAKTIDFCDELMQVTLQTKMENLFEFYQYLIAFTYIILFKHLNQAQKARYNSNLKVLTKIFAQKLNSANLLNYLLFNSAVCLVSKEKPINQLTFT